jgi:hypothetical protein
VRLTAPSAPKLSTILSISSLAPSDPESVLPSVEIVPGLDTSTPTTLRSSLPLLHVKIDKRSLDSLQLLADDLSQFFNSELASSTSFDINDHGRDREKMIGSRYFGTKSFRGSARFGRGSKGHGQDSEEEEDQGSHANAGLVKLQVELAVTDREYWTPSRIHSLDF